MNHFQGYECSAPISALALSLTLCTAQAPQLEKRQKTNKYFAADASVHGGKRRRVFAYALLCV